MKEFNLTLGVMEALKVQPFEIVSQDINGNKLNITLVRDGSLQPYLLTGTTVILYFKREDDIRYQQYATITNATQGQIEIVLDADIIANRGKVFAEVAVYVGEEMKCTSQLFAFLVRKNINDGETHVSGNDLPNYHREMQRLETILDNLIISAGDSNPEIVAARYSLLEGVTFTTLGDRLDFIESKIQTHIDTEIEDGAVHGIRVNEGELEFLLNGEWKKVSGMEVHDNDMHNPAFATASDLTTHLADYASLFTTNADAKNSIYRGKYLGNTISAEQYTAISSGTFTDLYIGDYWTIEGVNWRIAAFNYYRSTGDTSVPGNHITIVPDTQLYTHVMNDTNTTTGGYTGSKMYTEGLEQAKTTIRGIFGAHLVKHRQILSNATVDGKASGWAWVDSEVELMNEIMVYGASVFGAGNLGGGSGHNIGVGKSQLPLFRLNPRMINTRQNYWLRDVVSASSFAPVDAGGSAGCGSASSARGVRPAFSIS